jgi:hypothetical protein
VFPTGPYTHAGNPNLPGALASFGSDVSIALPNPTDHPIANPNYRGCIASAATP